MNVFNRIIMVIAMLCLMAFSIIAMLNSYISIFDWATTADKAVSYITSQNPFVLAAVLFFALVISLIILVLEFKGRKIKMADISADTTGRTMVTLKNSESQIRERLASIQDVIDPQVKIIPRQNGIVIDIFSKLYSGVNIVDKTKEIRETASNFASRNIGLKVLKINYTASGFVNKKVKEVNTIVEIPKEVKIA